jgi:glycerol-3-phosphate dehydrogenase
MAQLCQTEGVDRGHNLAAIESEGAVDVAILGGGVNGACLYDALCRQGYRTLLLDRGDFASGSSQASGMMRRTKQFISPDGGQLASLEFHVKTAQGR